MKRLVIIFCVSVMMLGCTVIKDRAPIDRYAAPAIVVSGHPKPYSVNGVTYYPLPSEDGFVEEGMASWYGKPFHGRKTSSGEIYNMHEITAAHKTLPFGTYVKVENLLNHREIVVRINDRGPFAKERIIDLYDKKRDPCLDG